MKRFEYDILTGPIQQIRLLKIDTEEPFQCSLSTFEIASCPDYDALSYTWGDPGSVTSHINLNRQRFDIRQNLHDFLTHVAHKLIPWERELCSYLWIDAICINQESDIDKSNQVNRMGEIYENAEKTIIWLGKGNADTQTAIQLIRDAALKLRTETWPPRHEQGYINAPSDDHSFIVRYNREFESLKSFFHLPYWARLWIVQEFMLAKERVIVCGSHIVSLSDMRDAYNSYENFRRLELQADELNPRLQHFLSPFVKPKLASTLQYLLCTFSAAECFDPRDKVFALRALALDAQDIIVDYSVDPAHLFWQTIRRLHWITYLDVPALVRLGVAMKVTGKEDNVICKDDPGVIWGWSYATQGLDPTEIFAKPEETIKKIVERNQGQYQKFDESATVRLRELWQERASLRSTPIDTSEAQPFLGDFAIEGGGSIRRFMR